MTLTLELPEDVAVLVQQAAGEQDVAAYATGVLTLAARRRVARRADDELTPADHVRMADAGEATAHSLEESQRRVFAAIDAMAEAKRR